MTPHAPRHGLWHRHGSFTVEEFGPRRLARLKSKEIHARARHILKLSQFKLR